jgi:hypothetical protein
MVGDFGTGDHIAEIPMPASHPKVLNRNPVS